MAVTLLHGQLDAGLRQQIKGTGEYASIVFKFTSYAARAGTVCSCEGLLGRGTSPCSYDLIPGNTFIVGIYNHDQSKYSFFVWLHAGYSLRHLISYALTNRATKVHRFKANLRVQFIEDLKKLLNAWQLPEMSNHRVDFQREKGKIVSVATVVLDPAHAPATGPANVLASALDTTTPSATVNATSLGSATGVATAAVVVAVSHVYVSTSASTAASSARPPASPRVSADPGKVVVAADGAAAINKDSTVSAEVEDATVYAPVCAASPTPTTPPRSHAGRSFRATGPMRTQRLTYAIVRRKPYSKTDQ